MFEKVPSCMSEFWRCLCELNTKHSDWLFSMGSPWKLLLPLSPLPPQCFASATLQQEIRSPFLLSSPLLSSNILHWEPPVCSRRYLPLVYRLDLSNSCLYALIFVCFLYSLSLCCMHLYLSELLYCSPLKNRCFNLIWTSWLK